MTGVRPGPLAGVRVVEVGHMLAGPYCGMLLADLGAEVIKVEPPSGDISRSVGPHTVGPHNVYFASLNRNKESVVLDLATRAGQDACTTSWAPRRVWSPTCAPPRSRSSASPTRRSPASTRSSPASR